MVEASEGWSIYDSLIFVRYRIYNKKLNFNRHMFKKKAVMRSECLKTRTKSCP